MNSFMPSLPAFGEPARSHPHSRAGQSGFRVWGDPTLSSRNTYRRSQDERAQNVAPRSQSDQVAALFAGCRDPRVAQAGLGLVQELREREQRASQAATGALHNEAPHTDRAAPAAPRAIKKKAPSALSPTAKEIALNLNELKKAIQAGQAEKIDREFIKIFANDLKELAKKSTTPEAQAQLTALKSLLREVGAELYTAQVTPRQNNAPEEQAPAQASHASNRAPVSEDTRPLIEQISSLKRFASRFAEGNDVRKGCELLDAEYRMHHIRGDGHCLFRSFAFSYVKSWLELSPSEQTRELRRLELQVIALATPTLAAKFAAFKAALTEAAQHEGTTSEQVIANPVRSDALVAFLREASCAFNAKSANDTFTAEMQRLEITKEHYLRDMADMSKKQNGTHLELNALAQFFETNIQVFDAAQIGREGTVRPNSAIHYSSPHASENHFLMYRSHPAHHFDVMVPIPKIEVEGENPDLD